MHNFVDKVNVLKDRSKMGAAVHNAPNTVQDFNTDSVSKAKRCGAS